VVAVVVVVAAQTLARAAPRCTASAVEVGGLARSAARLELARLRMSGTPSVSDDEAMLERGVGVVLSPLIRVTTLHRRVGASFQSQYQVPSLSKPVAVLGNGDMRPGSFLDRFIWHKRVLV
jgi:hypothetical protein